MFDARNLCLPLEISVIFMVFGVCLHSHSHRQNERIYGDLLIFKMKSYMAFVSDVIVSDVIDSISQIALEFPLFSSTRVINPRDYLLKRRYGNYLAKRTRKIRIDWASETCFWFCSQFHIRNYFHSNEWRSPFTWIIFLLLFYLNEKFSNTSKACAVYKR